MIKPSKSRGPLSGLSLEDPATPQPTEVQAWPRCSPPILGLSALGSNIPPSPHRQTSPSPHPTANAFPDLLLSLLINNLIFLSFLLLKTQCSLI